MVVRDAAASEQLPELLRSEEVALYLILQIGSPVESDRPGDVRLFVERRVLIDFHDPDRVVSEPLLEPFGLDENVLCVISH